MSRMKDLTGLRFGMLVVESRAEDIKPGRPSWNCRCDCGNTARISSTALTKTNGTRSCGCLRHKPSQNCVDLTGQQFGLLTVISKDHTVHDGKAKWLCRCECGNFPSVLSESLRNGRTRSCGCIVNRLKHDLSGMVFGHLLVLERNYDRRYVSNDTRWKCLCQNCGRTVSVSSYKLRTANPYGHCKCTRNKTLSPTLPIELPQNNLG